MRAIPALLVLVLCGLTPGAAVADTLSVAPGESIQAAVTAANPGDTIQLSSGSYPGAVLIDKELTVQGPADAVLDAVADAGEASAVVEVQDSGATLSGFTVDATDVGIGVLFRNAAMGDHVATVRDLTITGYLSSGLVARFTGLALVAERLTITGAGAGAPAVQSGIVVARGAVATIRDGTVAGNCGTTCEPGPDPTVETAAGIVTSGAGAPGVTVVGTTVKDNRVGIRSAGAERLDVLDARLQDNGTGLQVLDIDEDLVAAAATRGVVHGTAITGGTVGVLVHDGTPADGLRPAPVLRADRIVEQSDRGVVANVPVTATDVWWGCNAGPGAAGCSAVDPGVATTPHLVLRLAAGPTTIATGGGTASLTADVTRNSAGDATGASFPDGTRVAFATDRGVVDPGQTSTSAGTAGATLTADDAPGTATTSATLDGERVTAPVTIVAPAPPTTVPGPTTTVTETTTTPPTTVTVPAAAATPPPTVPPAATPTPAPTVVPPEIPTGAELLAAARKAIGRRVVRLAPLLDPGVGYIDRAARSGRGKISIPDKDVVSLMVIACPATPCDAGVSARVERTSKSGRRLGSYFLRRATFSLRAGRQRVVAVRLTRGQRRGIRSARTATMVVNIAVSGPGGERSKQTLRLGLRVRST